MLGPNGGNVKTCMRFEAREIKPYAEYVAALNLENGAVYFVVTFLDQQMLVPRLEPVVFIGRNLEDVAEERSYFQDAASFMSGMRAYGDKPSDDVDADAPQPIVYSFPDQKPPVMEYERAIDVLLYCAMKRAQSI